MRSCATRSSRIIEYQEKAGSFLEAPALATAAESLAIYEAESVVGRRFGHYTVLDLLGAGGMGTVYLAQDTNLGRKVALKLLPAYFTEDQTGCAVRAGGALGLGAQSPEHPDHPRGRARGRQTLHRHGVH